MAEKLIIIVPCYNEAAVLPKSSQLFLKQLQKLIRTKNISPDSQILFVDDGSKDETWRIIQSLSKQDPHFKGLRQDRNYGQQTALLAGLKKAKNHCDIAISLDCDGQDDPTIMPKMIDAYRQGADIVYGVRQDRKTDSFLKRHSAQIFYKFLHLLGAQTINNHSDYRLTSNQVLKKLTQIDTKHLFLRGSFPHLGFNSAKVYYQRKPRLAGKTHYSLLKMCTLAFNGIKQTKAAYKLPRPGLVWLFTALSFCLIFLAALITMFKQSPLASIPLVVSIILGLSLLRRHYQKISDRHLMIIQIITHIISLILMIIVAIYGLTDISWDWGAIIKTATTITLKNFNVMPDYFLRYPNNQFWLAFMTAFFTSCKNVFHLNSIDAFQIASIVLGILITRLTLIFSFLNAEKIFGLRRARLFDILSFLFIPLYLYAPFAYSDLPAMLLVSIFIYTYLSYKDTPVSIRNPRFWSFVLSSALIIALLLHIKVLALIIPFAALVAEVVNHKSRLKTLLLKYSVLLTTTVIFAALLALPVNSINRLDSTKSDLFRFPPTHWVMMSLNQTATYDQRDVEFTKSFPTYQERQTATTAKISERLHDLGFFGTIKHIFTVKLPRQWGDSLLAGDDFISRRPLYPKSFVERFFGLPQFGNDAKYHWLCLLLSWPYYILLLLGCLLSLVRARKLKHLHFSQIALVGAFLFFVIWECSSRYLIAFVPVLLLCSALGYFNLRDSFLSRPTR